MLRVSLQKIFLTGAISAFIFPVAAFADIPAASMASSTTPDLVINNGSPAVLATAAIPENEKLTALPTTATNSTRVSALPVNNSLAALDAQLAAAQNQLAGVQKQLGQGKQQLQQLTGTLRLAMNDAGPDANGLHPFVRVASRYLGTPYVWGGESRYGFDCSGFIIRVMRDLGYKALPHSAAEQFTYGIPVAKALLKPGDLVFFANTYKPGVSHVGIYLGHNQFIQAASTIKGTIVSDLREPFYEQHYAGARRLAPVK